MPYQPDSNGACIEDPYKYTHSYCASPFIIKSINMCDSPSTPEALAEIFAAIRQLQSQFEGSHQQLNARMGGLENACSELLERSKPRSNCIFCPLPENRDGHNTARCNRFPDPVAKSCQATRLGLCEKCLKPIHTEDGDCGVRCAACGRPHNVLLCSSRQSGPPFKRRRE